MTFPWQPVAQFALLFGGDFCLLRFSDGTTKELSYQENVWVEANGERLTTPSEKNTLQESLVKDSLKDLAQAFSQNSWLDAIELRQGKNLTLRLVRDTTSVLPKVQLLVAGEQNFSTELLIPIKKKNQPKEFSPDEYSAILRDLSQPLYATQKEGRVILTPSPSGEDLAGVIPAVLPEQIGAASFRRSHGLRYAYVAGAMAGGIASVDLVVSMAKAGYMGFFGAGGLPISKVEEALAETKKRLEPNEPFGFNLLHNPFEPSVEEATAALYLKYGVHCIDASAYMGLTPALVWYRFKGIHQTSSGIVCPNRVFAKVSRAEIASVFLAPPSAALLNELVQREKLTQEEARLAQFLPVADGVTAEADSGGHTDRRPLSVLIPLMLQVRDQAMEKYNYRKLGLEIHVGAAGGVAEPLSAKAALSLGAGYLMTGSLNQASLEAGTSNLVKKMLSEADMADVSMAPAPDMFEMGVQVQVLKRGTLYAQRAQKLYEVYKGFASIEEIPVGEREKLEKQLFRRSLQEVWQETESYWQARDPKEADKARQDGKHKMALCFRWYLGMSSRWGRIGDEGRKLDYQIWCGPAMGAFNRWAKGSSFEKLENRSAPKIAESILRGTAALIRLEAAQLAGVSDLPSVIEVSRPYD
jgi:trans-AT polyketide synthase/acyltransferase/oxidoreductase domain-containing protein